MGKSKLRVGETSKMIADEVRRLMAKDDVNYAELMESEAMGLLREQWEKEEDEQATE